MQVLYTCNRDKTLDHNDIHAAFKASVDASFELYLFHLYSLLFFLKVSQEDASNRKAKHLPTDEDKVFSDKIYSNAFVRSIIASSDLSALFKQKNFETLLDKDVLRKIYKDYSKTEGYKAFILSDSDSKEIYIEELLSAYKFMAKHEYYSEHVEERFHGWIDDKSLILGTMKKTLKSMPVKSRFFMEYVPQGETVEDFGTVLLKHVLEEDTELLETIDPVLENWDASRVAIVDMILIKMAICEMLYFPTIPTKVTLNEYVELAKSYSTDKSKDFINGILDKLMKKLTNEGKIIKEGRGLVG
ncbi:MAG: transcription antitermination factor NusB [Bacteroidia bacterium]|nr:transcription antitermination factor NusB [Bacteroidia bacterium]